jgi:hypothetical protein
VDNIIPTSPTDGYSHVNLNTFNDEYGRSVFTAKKVRFYCHTNGHTRKIHFYTRNNTIAQMTYDGSNTNNVKNLWTTGYTLLSDHTGYLPAATENTGSNLLYEPFFKAGSYHWSIRFSSGGRYKFECDDYANDYTQTTLHQIWVNTEVLSALTPKPSLSPTPGN